MRALLDPRRNLLTISTGIELGLAMKRREFIGLIGGAAAWPLAARAQQPTNLPLVAVIVAFAEQLANARSANIREGLKRAGFIEGKDYVMTLRFADGDYARLPEIIKDLGGLNPALQQETSSALLDSFGG